MQLNPPFVCTVYRYNLTYLVDANQIFFPWTHIKKASNVHKQILFNCKLYI